MSQPEILHLAQTRAAALVTRDLAAIENQLADNFVYTNANGDTFTKQQYLDTYVKSPDVTWHGQELSDVQIQTDDNTATLTAHIHDKATFHGTYYDMHFRTTQTYAKMNGEWKYITGHTVPDPQDV